MTNFHSCLALGLRPAWYRPLARLRWKKGCAAWWADHFDPDRIHAEVIELRAYLQERYGTVL